MKDLIVFGSLVVVLLASFPALAQHAQSGPGRGAGHGAPGRPMPPQQMPARDTTNRDARMTPEQRQQLKRDVHDHGRDIYRDRSGPAPRP